MRRFVNISQTGVLFLIMMLIISGCSQQHSVNTSSTKSLTKVLKSEVPAVKNVTYSFTRPDFTISIKMKETLSEETEDAILNNIIEFSSIENIDEIAKSVKWNSNVRRIQLIINNPSKEDPPVKYSSDYFKTYDASNLSEENIDGYETWNKYE